MESWSLVCLCLALWLSVCHGSNITTLLTNCTNSTQPSNYSECLGEEVPAYESCPDPSLCEIQNHGDNVGLAFGLTIAAGLSTTFGALLPFVPCIKRSNTLYLAAGLALAAGVMLYVSFTEIWIKAKLNFCCETTVHYDLLTTACFFGGIFVTILLDLLVTFLQKIDCGCILCCSKKKSKDIEASETKNEVKSVVNPLAFPGDSPPTVDGAPTVPPSNKAIDSTSIGSSPTSSSSGDPADSAIDITEEKSDTIRRNSYSEMVDQVHRGSLTPQGPRELEKVADALGKDSKKLHRMGILTGLAIAIHNFPEGLATFVATLADPTLGAALCIAIALHNIPEGVCVAMPVYYATGKRWKGFLWAFLSGISEPLGALLGWLVLKDVFGPLVYGISFGLISGMMVFISLKELLPTARKFDTTGGHLVNGFLVAGMVVMAISLILFLY